MARQQRYLRGPHTWGVYKWSPTPNDKNVNKNTGKKKTKNFCNANATPNKPGEDWTVSYVYEKVVDKDGTTHRYAYVTCNYVE